MRRAAKELPAYSQWIPVDENELELTKEEHAALMRALNPAYRVYVRSEPGSIVDVGLDEDEKEIAARRWKGEV